MDLQQHCAVRGAAYLELDHPVRQASPECWWLLLLPVALTGPGSGRFLGLDLLPLCAAAAGRGNRHLGGYRLHDRRQLSACLDSVVDLRDPHAGIGWIPCLHRCSALGTRNAHRWRAGNWRVHRPRRRAAHQSCQPNRLLQDWSCQRSHRLVGNPWPWSGLRYLELRRIRISCCYG